MKKNICYIAAILLFSALGNGLFAQKQKRIHENDYAKKSPQVALQNVQSKDVVTEFACNAAPTVFLENMMRRIDIQTWNDNKVKLVTTVSYQGNPGLTDEQWLEKLDINISGNANNVVVRSGNLHKPGMKVAKTPTPFFQKPDIIANGVAVFDSSGNWVNTKSNIKRSIVLYIPAGSKLDVESKYADVALKNNLKEVKLRISYGGFVMKDAEKLIVNSEYGGVRCESIGRAQVNLNNGRLSAQDIDVLNISSKNSLVDVRKLDQLKMDSSQADNFAIDEANTISGQKNYGDIRITTLSGSLDITGLNADIIVRSIDPDVTLIKINSRYADLRLPIGALENYQVNFEGEGGNVYAPFAKSRMADNSFKTTVGNSTGKPTLFQLKCNNCTVDFN